MTAEPHNPAGAGAAAAEGTTITSLRSYGLLGRSIAEAAGSFLLVLAGLGVAFFNPSGGLSAPLAFGLVLAAAMVAFGYISGGHFLPTITVGSALAGRTSWRAVLPYIVAQLVGALFAALILWVSMTGHPQIPETQPFFAAVANGFAENSATQFPLAGALLTEVIAAALLTAVFLGAGTRLSSAASAFAVGVTYAALLTFLVPITGGSINPARSTAVAVFAEPWAIQQLWLFWVAPLLGAAITGLIYRSLDFAVPASAVVVEDEIVEDEIVADDEELPAEPAAESAAAGSEDAARTKSDDAAARGFFEADSDDAAKEDEADGNGTGGPRS
ncbi:aquaporin [Arthrobacter gandavensis]|uniref:MIP/aquaporin family protein n=1 Tax=Arthrobacter gandavensis TaxID=169960 RepID=UPI00188FA759|nr:aquaporin [Arthrobacter gandavensis]MBF4993536.1 aquaporin [Arthrobacter gandavensis]